MRMLLKLAGRVCVTCRTVRAHVLLSLSPMRGSMQLQHPVASRLVVQPVHVLRQHQVAPPALLQPRQALMRGVGAHACKLVPACVGPRPVAPPRLGLGHELHGAGTQAGGTGERVAKHGHGLAGKCCGGVLVCETVCMKQHGLGMSCAVLSCAMLSCAVLSCPVLSCTALGSAALPWMQPVLCLALRTCWCVMGVKPAGQHHNRVARAAQQAQR